MPVARTSRTARGEKQTVPQLMAENARLKKQMEAMQSGEPITARPSSSSSSMEVAASPDLLLAAEKGDLEQLKAALRKGRRS